MSQERNTRVVVADTDRALLEMLQIRLDLAGYHTLAARNGVAALDLIRRTSPALVIFELRLPEIDGFGIIEELLLHREPINFKSLAMSKQWGPSEIRRAAALGVRACVTKPFSGQDILERAAKLLGVEAPAGGRGVVWV
jgi:DNA-binding response OmpR family regulator